MSDLNIINYEGFLDENGEIRGKMVTSKRAAPDYSRIPAPNADPTLTRFHEPIKHCLMCHVEIDHGLSCPACVERFRNELCR